MACCLVAQFVNSLSSLHRVAPKIPNPMFGPDNRPFGPLYKPPRLRKATRRVDHGSRGGNGIARDRGVWKRMENRVSA